MIHYVLGFLFSFDGSKVCLIEKNKPDFQKGKLNGVGGKVEQEDITKHEAMKREFKEETGVTIRSWEHVTVLLKQHHWKIEVYRCFSDDIFNIHTATDERVGIYEVDQLEDLPLMRNLQWMIPMLLDREVKQVGMVNYN